MKTESSYIHEESDKEQGLGRMPSRPTVKPKPVLIPRPVIDKNPAVAPPKLIINTVKKTANQKPQTISKPKTTNKSASKQHPNSPKDILSGSLSIGGMQVKKTHAAMATGGIAGGLLLWKILF